MKAALTLLAGAVLTFALILPAAGAEKTVTGELVDVHCQMKQADNVGEDHAGCAKSCARKGAPLGVLAADGVYTVTGEYTEDNNRRLIDFVAKEVRATGHVGEQDGRKTIHLTAIELAN